MRDLYSEVERNKKQFEQFAAEGREPKQYYEGMASGLAFALQLIDRDKYGASITLAESRKVSDAQREAIRDLIAEQRDEDISANELTVRIVAIIESPGDVEVTT